MIMSPKRPTRFGHKSHLTSVPLVATQDSATDVVSPLFPTVFRKPTFDGASGEGVRASDVVTLATPAPAIVAVVAEPDATAPDAQAIDDSAKP